MRVAAEIVLAQRLQISPEGPSETAAPKGRQINLAEEIRNMNWDRIEGNWTQLKGKARQQWGKLTDDDWDVVAGKRDELIGRIQKRYGKARDEAEKEVDQWSRDLE